MKNVLFWAHFSCFVMVEGGELPNHEEHTLMGVFFVVWEEGMGWGWRRNTKPEEHAQNGAFFVFRDGGGGELPKHEEHTLIGVFFVVGRRGWRWRC